MDPIIDGIARFQSNVFPAQRALYQKLARHGQQPKALVISCSDSRVVPEIITQSGPGDIFVVRNAGNIVPPFGDDAGGVTAAVEYAVVGLKVEHIVVCGHADCGAMKAVLDPSALEQMPSVATWLGHCRCAHGVFQQVHAGTADEDAARLMAMENVAAQLTHLRTHPCVAARVASGGLTLHGWLFDIESGKVLTMDGETRRFAPIDEGHTQPGEEGAVTATPHAIAAE